MGGITITGGRVLGPDGFEERPLAIEDGRIAAGPVPGASEIDAAGALVLPGIVDVHGDAFERQLMPRPGVHFDPGLALLETDRQLIANGITTAYHGLSVSWEPGLRSVEAGSEVVAALRAVRPRLACDTRLHLRWETFAHEAMDRVLGWLEGEDRPILAFNDHTTGMAGGGEVVGKLGKWAARAGLSEAAYRDEVLRRWNRRERVDTDISRMAAEGQARGAVLFAHDERGPEERARFRALGCRTCEFPVTTPTAEAARMAGEPVVLGAPNVLRGGSHTGAVCAASAVEAGLCTALASDYYYPALLAAPFVLARRAGMDLSSTWRLVSRGPAEAAGLADRGTLAPGARADVIVVRDEDPCRPRLSTAIVAGRPAALWPS